MTLSIPERLAVTCRATPERRAWLERLPNAIRELQDRWSLSLGAPFDGNEVSCARVAPAVRSDGTHAVLKLGMPHMEGEHEIQALRFWDGDPTVHLLEADEDKDTRGAVLLERPHRTLHQCNLNRPSAPPWNNVEFLALAVRAGGVGELPHMAQCPVVMREMIPRSEQRPQIRTSRS